MVEALQLGDEVADPLLGRRLLEAGVVGEDDLDLIARLGREAILEQVERLRRVGVGELEVGREALPGGAGGDSGSE